MRVLTRVLPILALLAFVSPLFAADEARLLRFADIHEDKVVFVYAGDIWLAPSAGGQAVRLTSHEGMELFPKFSPDGRQIAFSAEYSGTRQVHVVSVDGGLPKQLTFRNDVGAMPPRGGFDNQVLDWSRDGKHVLFRANRTPFGVRMGRPYLVPVAGGDETPTAITEGGTGSFSPDGTKIVYTPIAREFRTWKRYRGGRAQDVWVYDLSNDTAEQITRSEATDNMPVWIDDKIYFTSDRNDGRLNLFAFDLATRDVTQVTRHSDFDVLWPSGGPSRIVYEAGGYLYRFDPATGRSEKISITLSGDFHDTLPHFKNVKDNIDSAGLSPSGKRALFGARGDVFTLPAEHGAVRNLTRTPGIREIDPAWSPDGKSVAYLSDRSGEYELYVRDQDGSGEERRLTRDGNIWRFPPLWSPDGKKIAFGDKNQKLWFIELDGGKLHEVDSTGGNYFNYYRWSPDSRWLAYHKIDENFLASIHLYSLDSGKATRIGDGMTNDYSPVFDPDGRYLYFLSDRDYNLEFSGYEFNYFYVDPTRVYAATLAADGPALLRPKSDEEGAGDKKNGEEKPKDDDQGDKKKKIRKGEKGEAKQDEGAKPIKIDLDGITNRVVALPAPSGNYGNLQATAAGLFFVQRGDEGPKVRMFAVESEKVEDVLAGVSDFVVSGDGKKLLYRQRSNYGIVDAKPGQKPDAGKLDLSGLTAKIDPLAEWEQIFRDGWRLVRDWFYDEGLHGLDWQAMYELYHPLVRHVRHRADLDYILGELGGELNAGHFYVNYGDMPRPERLAGGLLGAELERDPSGAYRIARVFPGENWHDAFRSPLTEAGVDVKPGQFVLAVDGRPTSGVDNFYELLENAANRSVTLTVADGPEGEGKTVRVRPVDAETDLRYIEWIQQRRELVDRLSGGRIGYIHLPNTSIAGNRELRKYFYPQVNKDALIFDARYNGGGFIPDRMIELVARTPMSYWARRGIQMMRTPGYAHAGPKACLINGYSASGGDAFPYYFRQLGLGPLIGSRTWGGLIGLSGNPGFMDGGSISIPVFRFIDTDGNWAVENVGVAPDIEVYDRPDLLARGQDPTLERAIEVLMEELRRGTPKRVVEPEAPRYPR